MGAVTLRSGVRDAARAPGRPVARRSPHFGRVALLLSPPTPDRAGRSDRPNEPRKGSAERERTEQEGRAARAAADLRRGRTPQGRRRRDAPAGDARPRLEPDAARRLAGPGGARAGDVRAALELAGR